MSTVQPELEAVVRQQIAAVLARLPADELGDEMTTRLVEAIPELARSTDPDFRTSLVLSCQSNLAAVFELLRNASPLGDVKPPEEAIAWSHELVHRGVPLPALLRAYRLGHALAEQRFEEMSSELEIEPEIRWRTLARASHYFFAYIDAVCTELVDVYEHERAQWIRGAAAARAELVGAILERRPVDPRLAAEKLRYDVSRRHLALIVWSEPRDASRPRVSLETEAAKLATALGGGAALTVPVGERVVWAWTWGEHLADEPAAVGHRMSDGVRAAIGTPAAGLAGMAESHEEALAARRVAELRKVRSAAVVGYRAGGLTALLTADPAEAVRFAEAELGELVADNDSAARLRATVQVYLEENLSPARAARRLGVHQNTVVYRVKRAEELLGREIGPRRLQTEVALRLAEMLDGLRAAAERARTGSR
jgi:DNA-binding PucR family transcriptional regulator